MKFNLGIFALIFALITMLSAILLKSNRDFWGVIGFFSSCFWLKPPNGIKITTTKKGPSTSTGSNSKSSVLVPCRNVSDRTTGVVQGLVSSSPTRSDDQSESMAEAMLSPNVEYIDKDDVSGADSIDRKTFSSLFISDHADKTSNRLNIVKLNNTTTFIHFFIDCDVIICS